MRAPPEECEPSAAERRVLRLVRSDLEPAAERLLRVVEERPGITPNAARGKAGLHWKVCERVLQDLLGSGRLTSFQDARGQHLFIPRPGLPDQWRQVVALTNPRLRLLLVELMQRPHWPRHQLLQRALELEWRPSSTEKRLEALVALGLVTNQTPLDADQRRSLLQAAPTARHVMGQLWPDELMSLHHSLEPATMPLTHSATGERPVPEIAAAQ